MPAKKKAAKAKRRSERAETRKQNKKTASGMSWKSTENAALPPKPKVIQVGRRKKHV